MAFLKHNRQLLCFIGRCGKVLICPTQNSKTHISKPIEEIENKSAKSGEEKKNYKIREGRQI